MSVRRWFAALMAVSCFSLQDVKNEGCRVLCVRDGYTSGQYITKKDSCACIDAKKYEDLTLRKTTLGQIESHPISAEDKALGLVAPFRSSLRKSSIFNNTPGISDTSNPYSDNDDY